MNEFIFTTEQRETLISVSLNKFPTDKTEVFLNESQRIIGEWLKNNPTRYGNNKTSRERLQSLDTQLSKTIQSLKLLPQLAQSHFEKSWQSAEHTKQGWPDSLNEIENFLMDLQRCAACSIPREGISKSIEGDLIEGIAWAYVDTYNILPTTTPEPRGEFISYLNHLSCNILSPQIGTIILGKDLISGVIKHVKNRCSEYNKFIQS